MTEEETFKPAPDRRNFLTIGSAAAIAALSGVAASPDSPHIVTTFQEIENFSNGL